MKNIIDKIKSIFIKAEPLDSTPNDNNSPIDNFESFVPTQIEDDEPQEDNVIQKGLSTAKSIINNGKFSVFEGETEEAKKIKKDEFKKSWIISVMKIIMGFIILLISLLCLVMIYKLCYGMLYNSDISSIGKYSDFMVKENNLSPTFKENDLIIIEKQDYYSVGDVVLYEFAGSSHKIGKIEDIVRGYYIVTDNIIEKDDYNSKISEDLIVGKEIKTYSNVNKFYNFIQSPIAIIILVGIIALYFYLISKGKIEERRVV